MTELQQWVKQLKDILPGASEDRNVQKQYLKLTHKLATKCAQLTRTRWWPRVFMAAWRGEHQGRVVGDVDPEEVHATFKDACPSDLSNKLVSQARHGQEIYLTEPVKRDRSKLAPSAAQYVREVWATLWKDAALGRTFIFSPDSLKLMDLAQVQCY